MKKSWFTHTGLTTEEANELEARYKSKDVPVEKSLDIDPRLWIVSALLPQQNPHLRRSKVCVHGHGGDCDCLQHPPDGKAAHDACR